MIDKQSERDRVVAYLQEKLAPLTIEKDGVKPTSAIELSASDGLIGLCWESTQTCGLFFNDTDFIERGIVTLGEDPFYYHSWLCFCLDGKEYVFDPALNQIATKQRFYEKFKPQIRGRISAKQVKNYFLKFLSDPQMRADKTSYQRLMYKVLDPAFIKYLEGNNTIWGTGEATDPFFAGAVSYSPTLQGDNIKKLNAKIHDFNIK